MTQRLSAPSSPVGAHLGKHHCAHLRAVAQGVPVIEAARRYLGIEHGHEAVTAHRAALDLASAVARRRGDARWRLLGAALPPAALPVTVPSLEEWAAAQGLGDWSADELLSLYEEKFGASGDGSGSGNDSSQRRRSARNARLQVARLALLHELEAQAADQPTSADALAGWLHPALARELLERGVANLGELQALIARGGRWWSGLRAYGPVKAARLQRQVEQLIGAPARSWSLHLNAERAERATALSGEHGANRAAPGVATIAARDDRAAVQAWIAARAGSVLTARAYEREADRFILWIVLERCKALSDAGAEDCRAYMDFLAAVPLGWISRHHVPRLAPGWAPFAGPLSVGSQRQAVGIVHSLFQWLVQAGYLRANPWALVRRRIGDELEAATRGEGSGAGIGESSRAFTPAAWKALQAQADKDTETPATAARMRWLLVFAEATGLRASELVNARRGHFARRKGAWWLRVLGKGARNRSVPVPSNAMKATIEYFVSRGVDFESAAHDMPLLASTAAPGQPLSYPALHQAFKSFVLRALRHSSLPAEERREADAASTHWLRHTHATRAVERGVGADVLQANMGHADPRTTAGYFKTQLDRRLAEMERAFAN
jgi:integrase